jgi:hypothetical protein
MREFCVGVSGREFCCPRCLRPYHPTVNSGIAIVRADPDADAS